MMTPLTGSRMPSCFHPCCRGTATSFVQLALNLRNGERSALKFIERGDMDAVTTLCRLLAYRACSPHPNIVQLQVRCREL